VFAHNSEALDYIYGLLNTNKSALNLNSVWYGDENFTAPYPAAVCVPGGMVRDYVATRTFEILLQVSIFVLHADMSASHHTRTRQDLLYAEAIVDFLHQDYTLGGNVLNGWVGSETPGVTNRPKGNAIVSTSLAWTARSRAPFGG
jgi:hypothetical protein